VDHRTAKNAKSDKKALKKLITRGAVAQFSGATSLVARASAKTRAAVTVRFDRGAISRAISPCAIQTSFLVSLAFLVV